MEAVCSGAQLRTLEELAQPARVFAADPDFQPVKVSFITQDEVDAMISEYPATQNIAFLYPAISRCIRTEKSVRIR